MCYFVNEIGQPVQSKTSNQIDKKNPRTVSNVKNECRHDLPPFVWKTLGVGRFLELKQKEDARICNHKAYKKIGPKNPSFWL